MRAADIQRIVERIHGPVTALPTPVAGGWSGTQIWRVELEEGPHLLRLFNRHDDVVATHEALAMEHGVRHGLPIPRVVARGIVDGRAALLLEWLEGRQLGEVLLSEPERSEVYGEQFGQLQARLHRLDPPAELSHALDWPAPEAYPPELRSMLSRMPDSSERFLHLDFHPANVLASEGTISGLIDWTNASRGDPRFDIARTWLILRSIPSLLPESDGRLQAISRKFTRGWHRSYRAVHGPVHEIAPFLAWAGYGLRLDLGGKPSDLIGDDAVNRIGKLLGDLERDTRRWMSMAGL